MTSLPLVDYDVLNENTMNNADLQKELFELFFQQGEEYMAQLNKAVAQDDLDQWRMTTHGIKGASRSLGFLRLAALACEWEQLEPDAEAASEFDHMMTETRERIALARAA